MLKTLCGCALFLFLYLYSIYLLYNSAQSQTQRVLHVYEHLASMHLANRPGSPYPQLVLEEQAQHWPQDIKSYAFEKTHLTRGSAIHFFEPWAHTKSNHAIAFVLAHEAGHGLCNHYSKTLGIYALRSQAVGATLHVLASAMDSDFGFRYLNEALESTMEHESDAYAALALRDAGLDPLAGFDQALGGDPGGFGHSDYQQRRAHIEAALATQSSASTFLLSCQKREPTDY